MCAVWVCVPSARPVPEVTAWAKRWQAQGYKVALWRDEVEDALINSGIEWVTVGKYPGYAKAANRLIGEVFRVDSYCDWVVATGDDTDPDMAHTADEIAESCAEHFAVNSHHPHGATFGVMQPTGDRWGDDATSRLRWPNAPAMIDRIAGSPWIGRSFANRINQGRGPLWPQYFHNWADQELQEVATKLGVFWQRYDLIHFHNHSRRHGGPWLDHQRGFDLDYVRMKPVFDARQKAGFPGSEPIV